MARINRIHFVGFLALLSLAEISGQPTWFPGTPSIASTGQLTITLNYGLTRAGTVYIIVFNFDNQAVLTSSYVRSRALAGPSGNIVATSVRNVQSNNTNKVLQVTLDVTDPGQVHAVYIVAASRLGILQSSPVRLTASTLPCQPINAGTGGTECDLNFVLNATLGGGTGQWTMISGPGSAIYTPNPRTPNATVTVSSYGTYVFRWTETNGICSGSADISVIFYQQPVANAGRGDNVCSNTFVLNALPGPATGTGTWTMTSGTGTAVFSPDANTPGATVTVSEYGTKVFTWTVTNGPCANSSDVSVSFFRQPVPDPGTGGDVCGLELYLNATPSIGTGTWTRVSGPGNAIFSPDASTPNARVTVSRYGDYIFRWTEVNGYCSADATISVSFFEQLSANAGNGGNECDKDFLLNAVPGLGTGTWTMVSGPGNASFIPDANQPDARVTVSQFGSYDFAWTELTANCSSVDVIRVVFREPPAVNAGNDLAVCKGNTIQLEATGSGSFMWAPASLLNNPAIPNPVASPVLTSTFTVTLTDQWGCFNSDQVVVQVREQPLADAGPDQELEFVFETLLEAGSLQTGETGEWKVYSGSGEFDNKNNNITHVRGLQPGSNNFIWTVSNGVCAPVSDTVNIKISDLIIPTLITPNLDGKNDFFILNGIESIGKTRLIVFNRWGAMVYEEDDYKNDWDGRNNTGEPLANDTYFFILIPEKIKPLNGYIVIKR